MQHHLSGITEKDKYLLQQMVCSYRPDSRAYEDSWGYIIQATRYNGFKWWDSSSKMLIFFGQKSENEKVLVVPNFFTTPQLLAKVLSQIHTMNIPGSSKVIIKNVDSSSVTNFFPFGFRIYKPSEAWDTLARFDDQTFPQPIIDLKSIVESNGKRYKRLRNNVIRNESYKFRDYDNSDLEDVLNLFKRKDQIEYERSKQEGQYYITHKMYPYSSIDKYVITYNNVLEGFVAASNITNQTFALCASIFLPTRRGVSIWASYKVFKNKLSEGFTYANLGGSEYLGTDRFKEWNYKPIDHLCRTHLVYECNPH